MFLLMNVKSGTKQMMRCKMWPEPLLSQAGINCFGVSVAVMLSKFTLPLWAHCWGTGLIPVDILVTCLTDKEQVTLCLHKAEPQLHPVSILENEEKYCSYEVEEDRRYQATSPPSHSQPSRLMGLWKNIQIILLFCSWFGMGNGWWKCMGLDLQELRELFNWQLSAYWEKQASCSCWQLKCVQLCPKKGNHVYLLISGRISLLHKLISEE